MLTSTRAAGLLSSVLVLACSSRSTTTQVQPPSTTATPTPVIALGALTVRFQDMPIARMHADGRTESVGANAPGKNAIFTPGPTFHADGTIDLTKGGYKIRVESDGDIVGVPPPGSTEAEQPFGRLSGTELVMTGSSPGGFRIDGEEVIMFSGSAITNRIGFVDPPSMGRTALIMAAAFMIDSAITGR